MNAARNGMQTRTTSQYVKAPKDRAWFRDDFFDALTSTFAVTGAATGQLTGDGVAAVGMLQQSVAAAGVDGHRIMAGASASPRFIFGAGPLVYEARLKIPTLSNGVDNLVCRVGFLSVTTGIIDTTDGVYFEYDFGTFADQFWRICSANNSARTKTSTGIAPVAGSYQRLKFKVDQAVTSVTAFINDVQCGTVVANLPTVARSAQLCIQTSKSLGAGVLVVNADYVDTTIDFVPSR